MKPEINIFETPDDLAIALADNFQQVVNHAANLDQNFYIAISGGSTPVLFFQTLAKPPFQHNISWKNVHFFWVDERCVPSNHHDSNYGVTKKNLLDNITIPEKNIHRIVGAANPFQEAIRYAEEIKNVAPKYDTYLLQFDWILLGLGTDGHTASIFPGSDMLEEKDHICAVATHSETGQKRITLTLPVINNAKRISFLVTGESKVVVVAKILNKAEDSKIFPAALVQPFYNGIWIVRLGLCLILQKINWNLKRDCYIILKSCLRKQRIQFMKNSSRKKLLKTPS